MISHNFLTDTAENLNKCIHELNNHRLIVVPTETVYGLAGNAYSNQAIEKIYILKQRPFINPLIVHVFNLNQAKEFASVPPLCEFLAKKFSPGPLTFILNIHNHKCLSPLLYPSRTTVAVRIPQHPSLLKLLKRLPFPLAAPSANRTGYISPTHSHHILQGLPNFQGYILEGGNCEHGVESTVIDLSSPSPQILREGPITQDHIENYLKQKISVLSPQIQLRKSPGTNLRHYSPTLPLRLNATTKNTGEAYIGFGPSSIPTDANLSLKKDLREACHNLFDLLYTFDRPEFSQIAIAPIPCTALGRVLNDRLSRAAAVPRTN